MAWTSPEYLIAVGLTVLYIISLPSPFRDSVFQLWRSNLSLVQLYHPSCIVFPVQPCMRKLLWLFFCWQCNIYSAFTIVHNILLKFVWALRWSSSVINFDFVLALWWNINGYLFLDFSLLLSVSHWQIYSTLKTFKITTYSFILPINI